MAWETRKRGGRYYTRSRKVDGRVVREYIGAGVAGDLAAAQDERKRARRVNENAARRRELARDFDHDAIMRDYFRKVDMLLQDALKAAGYYQHQRGEWRRRRDTSAD